MRLAAAIIASLVASNAVLVAAIVAENHVTRRRRSESFAEPCRVVVLDAHRAARKPGSNVALIRGGR